MKTKNISKNLPNTLCDIKVWPDIAFVINLPPLIQYAPRKFEKRTGHKSAAKRRIFFFFLGGGGGAGSPPYYALPLNMHKPQKRVHIKGGVTVMFRRYVENEFTLVFDISISY